MPCAISSFFEICDTNPDGSKIEDPLRIGARGGGFILEKGNTTRALSGKGIDSDQIRINGRKEPSARTSLRVLQLLREKYDIDPVKVLHTIDPPVGTGFGTSGAGAVGVAIAVSSLFDLRLTLAEASAFAHKAEIDSVTGLGTVISLVSGTGAVGLVTEPGCFSVGRVDCILEDYRKYTVFCACFGPIEKSTVLRDQAKRQKVNEYGKKTLDSIIEKGTVEALLKHSRIFAEKTGLASRELLRLADKSIDLGAIGATQNMIGNAIHCLVPKSRRKSFLKDFGRVVPETAILRIRALPEWSCDIELSSVIPRLRNT